MKKIFAFCILLVIGFFYSEYANAGVRSITNSANSSRDTSGDSGENNYDTQESLSFEIPQQSCPKAGYTHHGCPSGYRPVGECPYESGYYMGCCQMQYQYLMEDCLSAGLKPSSDNCYGYYACETEEQQTPSN